MDQHELVRKSVARISFKWPNNPHKKDKIVTVVIPGTIVSIKDDGSCVVIADPTFFREKNCPFVVNLPIAGGYDDVPVAPSMQFFVQGFCALVLQVQPNGYAQPVTFETRPVLTLDRVYAFMFQQNVVSTATAYCPGSIVHGEEGQWGKLSIGIPFHSYGYGRFGSPIFNQSGHLVRISRTPMEAWSVNFLQQTVFRGPEMSSVLGSVSYVLNGNPIPPEGPILPEGPVLPV